MVKECPQCNSKMQQTKFDLGYGVEVESLHCEKCGFNITDDAVMKSALSELREHMAKEVIITRVGTGLGIRFPNEIVKNLELEQGESLLIKPETDGIKLVLEREA